MDKFEWTCERCNKKFNHKKSVPRHRKTCRHSSKPASFTCTSCQKSFNRLDVLKRHQKTCQRKKKSTKQCQICLKVFAKTSNLKRHHKVHNFPWKCEMCNLILHQKTDIVKHKASCGQNIIDEYEFPTMVEIKDIYQAAEKDQQNKFLQTFTVTYENDQMEEQFRNCSDNFDWSLSSSKEVLPDDPVQTTGISLPETPPRNNANPFTATIATQTPTKGVSFEPSTVTKATQTPKKNASSNSLSSNARKRKSRLANQLVRSIEDLGIENEQDTVKIVTLALKKLGILDTFNAPKKPSKAGRRMISLETRHKVWDFWHSKSIQSTLTSRPAKLKVSDKPKIQLQLEFVDTMTILKNKRGVTFYQNTWMILEQTIKELFINYQLNFKEHPVSYGTFLALKPFYIRGATTSDIEMCCCKMHLHARWAIKALVDCASKQEIPLEFNDYTTFFNSITSNCTTASTTYIGWECTPDKKMICAHVKENWVQLKNELLSRSNPNVLVGMMHFEKVSTVNKQGKEVIRLKPLRSEMNIASIITFIADLMPNIIHHRNQLKHYRNTISEITDMFDTVSIDIDFSENLSVPVK